MRKRRLTAACGLAAASLLAILLSGAVPAQAYGPDEGRPPVEGGADNGVLTAEATQVVITASNGNTGPGNLTPSNTRWSPPVCWYEPAMTPSQLAAAVDELESTGELGKVAVYLSWSAELFRQHYEEGGDTSTGSGGYENFNLDREGEGMWWRGVVNPNRADEYTWDDGCRDLMFWADLSEAPGVEEALTPEILAGYAYDAIAVPETEFELNPASAQVVNLDTWIWGEAGSFEPVTVRAELPGTGLWAETTARPVSFTIDPGTDDATVHPSRDGCPISGDGTVGSAYTEGNDGPPPCGVTYRRATHHVDGYRLTAAVTWEISWTGTGVGEPQELPRAVFETTRDIEVREVQAVVRP